MLTLFPAYRYLAMNPLIRSADVIAGSSPESKRPDWSAGGISSALLMEDSPDAPPNTQLTISPTVPMQAQGGEAGSSNDGAGRDSKLDSLMVAIERLVTLQQQSMMRSLPQVPILPVPQCQVAEAQPTPIGEVDPLMAQCEEVSNTVREAAKKRLPAGIMAFVTKEAALLKRRMITLAKARATVSRYTANLEELANGRIPAGQRPWKLPFESEYFGEECGHEVASNIMVKVDPKDPLEEVHKRLHNENVAANILIMKTVEEKIFLSSPNLLGSKRF